VVEFSSTGELLSDVTTSALVATNLRLSNCCNPAIFMPNGEFLLTSVVSPTVATASVHSLNGTSKVDVEVSRFTAKRKKDSTFTLTPISFTAAPEDDLPQIIALQANGQILIGGADNTAGAFARLNADSSSIPRLEPTAWCQRPRWPASWYRPMETSSPVARMVGTWYCRGFWPTNSS
jgi:hypothetical protein